MVRLNWIAIPLLFLTVTCGFGQGLVLKNVTQLPAGCQVWNDRSHEMTSEYRDFDGNGSADLMVWTSSLQALSVYGIPGMNLLWAMTPVGNGMLPLFVDLMGDGIKEVLYNAPVDNPGFLTVYSVVDGIPILMADSLESYDESVLLRDYDADGLQDIVLKLPGERDSHGTRFYRFEIWGAGTVNSAPPSSLTIVPDSLDLVLNWQPVDSCSLYNIEWALDFDGPFASIGQACLPSFSHPGAAIVRHAYYRVKAVTSTFGPEVVARGSWRGSAQPTSR